MVGPTYGDFHIKRQWTQNETKVLDFAQDGNIVLSLRVREFFPSIEELLFDDARGNMMYGIPWAIADPDEATRVVNLCIDSCTEAYLDTILDDSNHLEWDVFHWALKISMFPKPVCLRLFPTMTDGHYMKVCGSDSLEQTHIQRTSPLGGMPIPGGPLAVLGGRDSRRGGPLAPLRREPHCSSATVYQLSNGRYLHGADFAANTHHSPEAASGCDASQQSEQLVHDISKCVHPATQLRTPVPVP